MNRFAAEDLKLSIIRGRMNEKIGLQTITIANARRHQQQQRVSRLRLSNLKKDEPKDQPEMKTSWGKRFREYRSHADSVVDLLRKQGYNAKLVLRVATDRDWHMDIRDQQFWIQVDILSSFPPII